MSDEEQQPDAAKKAKGADSVGVEETEAAAGGRGTVCELTTYLALAQHLPRQAHEAKILKTISRFSGIKT